MFYLRGKEIAITFMHVYFKLRNVAEIWGPQIVTIYNCSLFVLPNSCGGPYSYSCRNSIHTLASDLCVVQ